MSNITKHYAYIAVCFLFVCLGLVSHAEAGALAPNPLPLQGIEIKNKGLSDNSTYHILTLNNGLKVILVSDPKAERFSASMSVRVGSYQDPNDQQGLAHLLEHMLFLGTKKYPATNSYQAYIRNHGGSFNAYTTTDTTNFYFDILPDSYTGALDRFSQFFISPMLDKEFIQKEKGIVDSEYKEKIKSENRRAHEALKTLFNPEHPQSRFTVGSTDTLSDRPGRPLSKQLTSLYNGYYVAKNMALVLVANLPYQQLGELANTYFSSVTEKTAPTPEAFPPLLIGKAPKVQFIKPLIRSNTLTFLYQIDKQAPHYQTKPTRYLSYILGNEGKDSLYETLRTRGLATALSTTTSPDYGNNALFKVNIRLTNKGMHQIDDVASLFFSTINTLKSSGIHSGYLKEELTLSRIAYNYYDYVQPKTLARILSPKMLSIPLQDTLSSFRIEKVASNQEVQRLLNELSPKNLIVQVSTQKNQDLPKQWTKDSIQWHTEPWYKTEYSNNESSQYFLNLITRAKNQSILVKLPSTNPFIPDSLDLVSEKDKTPHIVYKKEGFTYWNKSDPSFGKPTAINFLCIRYKNATNTAKNTLLSRLWTSLFSDSISKDTYNPYVAGLGFTVYPHINGITLRTTGYSDKQDNYLAWLIDRLFAFQPTQSRFDIFKKQLQQELENQKNQLAYVNANSSLKALLITSSYTTTELESALSLITLDDLQAFIQAAKSHFDMTGYSTGNISNESTQKLADTLYKRFYDHLTSRKPLEIETQPLKPKQRLHYQFQSTTNDSVVLYSIIDKNYQHRADNDDQSILEKSYFSILTNLLRSTFYDDIRTQKQLGYTVGVENLSIGDTPIIGFLVQSSNANTNTLINAVEGFLNKYQSKFLDTSENNFESAKNTLLHQLESNATTLSDNAFSEWHEIAKNTPDFNYKQQWIKTIQDMKRENFIAFFEKKIQAGEATRLIIHNQPLNAKRTTYQWTNASFMKLYPPQGTTNLASLKRDFILPQ